MSSSHALRVCSQWLCLGLKVPGTSTLRLTVEADAAKPQRDGITQDSWSRKIRPVTGTSPPASASGSMSHTTSSGMICSLERAIDDNTTPRIAEATQVAATVTNSSKLEL